MRVMMSEKNKKKKEKLRFAGFFVEKRSFFFWFIRR